MAIHLRQLGRTLNTVSSTVSFDISGITGDRQTLVYIPEKSEYVTLSNAVAQGYIRDFSSTDPMNGIITLIFSQSIAAEFPVWQVLVQNCHTENGITTVLDYGWAVLCTQFNYDNEPTKEKGKPIDLTAADMNRLSLFASQIESAYTGKIKAEYYNVNRGEPIIYEHIREVARGLYNAMDSGGGIWNDGELVAQMREQLKIIVDDTGDKTDWQPEAETYNLLSDAINNLDFDAAIYG